MSEKRYSVENWGDKPHLEAASMRVTICNDVAPVIIGIDFLDQRGVTFAHGHLDLEVMDKFWRSLGEAIAEMRLTIPRDPMADQVGGKQ